MARVARDTHDCGFWSEGSMVSLRLIEEESGKDEEKIGGGKGR